MRDGLFWKVLNFATVGGLGGSEEISMEGAFEQATAAFTDLRSARKCYRPAAIKSGVMGAEEFVSSAPLPPRPLIPLPFLLSFPSPSPPPSPSPAPAPSPPLDRRRIKSCSVSWCCERAQPCAAKGEPLCVPQVHPSQRLHCRFGWTHENTHARTHARTHAHDVSAMWARRRHL